jgi:hypothetical protein
MGSDAVTRTSRGTLLDELSTWASERFFAPVPTELDGAVVAARTLIRESGFSDHPIFVENRLADMTALRLWASQELVVSTYFGQTIAAWLARIDNCNLRALILPVFVGEHGEFGTHDAPNAHPNLALKFATSLALDPSDVHPRTYASKFIETLWRVANEASMIYVAGFIGVGNERLILREYALVKRAAAVVESAAAVEFLDENIAEDSMHSRAMELFASALIGLGDSSQEYARGALDGITTRRKFYDGLYDDLARGDH